MLLSLKCIRLLIAKYKIMKSWKKMLNYLEKKWACENISSYLPNYTNATPTATSNFKLGTVMEVTSDQTDTKITKNLPVGNCEDGVSINSKTTGLRNKLYGINTPDFWCITHTVDGSLKFIAKSYTMCIDKVKSFCNNLFGQVWSGKVNKV